MAAQQNLARTLKLIRLLKQRPGKTLAQLAQILECTPRHARRYINALEEAGFIIDSTGKRPPRFYIFEDESRQPWPGEQKKPHYDSPIRPITY